MIDVLRWFLIVAAGGFGVVYTVLGFALLVMGIDGLRYKAYSSSCMPVSALILGVTSLGAVLLCGAAIWGLL